MRMAKVGMGTCDQGKLIHGLGLSRLKSVQPLDQA